MQQALITPSNGDRLRSGFEPRAFAFPGQRLSSPSYRTHSGDLLYGYSSPFTPSFDTTSPSPLATSISLSPSSSASLVDEGGEGAAAAAAATARRLHLARLALQYQELADRYELCLSHLADAADEAAVLRRENAELRMANGELIRRLAMLSSKQSAAVAIADEIRRLRLSEQQAAAAAAAEEKCVDVAEKRTVLPKSISIRSSGYLKMNPSPQATTPPASRNGKPRASNPAAPSSHRVFVGVDSKGGGEQKEEQKEQDPGGLEFEVYNQGMFKTELCNKWEETGSCPYGDQCQFAHGIAELRPVIRHPRYKTEVCRMVLSGDACPYGHRCHFRHSLTPSDRLLLHP